MKKQFWMVWSEQSHETHARHEDEATAEREAERLARIKPGCKFFVMLAVGFAEQPREPRLYHRLDDGIPF